MYRSASPPSPGPTVTPVGLPDLNSGIRKIDKHVPVAGSICWTRALLSMIQSVLLAGSASIARGMANSPGVSPSEPNETVVLMRGAEPLAGASSSHPAAPAPTAHAAASKTRDRRDAARMQG